MFAFDSLLYKIVLNELTRKIWIALLVLTLNWAALHDIFVGEPDDWMVWLFMIGSALLLVSYFIGETRHVACSLPNTFTHGLVKTSS